MAYIRYRYFAGPGGQPFFRANGRQYWVRLRDEGGRRSAVLVGATGRTSFFTFVSVGDGQIINAGSTELLRLIDRAALAPVKRYGQTGPSMTAVCVETGL